MESEWLEFRKGGITGTDAAAIMGVGRKTPYRIWLEKTGRVEPPDLDGVELVYWGGCLEGVICKELATRTGREIALVDILAELCRPHDRLPPVVPCDMKRLHHRGGEKIMFLSREHPWLRVTPDALSMDWAPMPHLEEQREQEGYGMVEIKTCGQMMGKDWADGPPPYYLPQIITNTICAGLSWGTIAVLIGGQEFRMYDVPVSESTREEYLDKLGTFWEKHVLADIPPELGPGDVDSVKEVHPTSDGSSTVISCEALHWDKQLQTTKAAIKDLEAVKSEAEAKLRDAIGDAESATIEGTGVSYTLKETHRKASVREIKASTFRTLRRKEAKDE